MTVLFFLFRESSVERSCSPQRETSTKNPKNKNHHNHLSRIKTRDQLHVMSNSFSPDNEEQQFHLSHHPSPPPHELFDVSTTVDPSYVISMIRKLLPSDVKGEHDIKGGLIREETKTGGLKEGVTCSTKTGEVAEPMESSENLLNPEGPEPGNNDNNQGRSKTEEMWEECGCILWDLSASEDHAQFMVQNLILEVLLANLTVSQSPRIIEISLGIIGNLACHESPRKKIASTDGLVRVIVEQLLLDDVPCLCEACRVLTLCLGGSEGIFWAEALQTEQMLWRIIWIAENALNPQLISKIVGLILAILESQQEVAAILIPAIMQLELSTLLIKLLAFEMNTLRGGRVPERYPVLDVVLRAVEAISTMDEYSQEICLNKELLGLVKELIELPDKFEVSIACVTAAVLTANMLTDAIDLASGLSRDVNFLRGLFDVLPFASDDVEAQSAIWSVISRLLVLVCESETGPSNFRFLVSTLTSKLDLIEDELLACPLDRAVHDSANTSAEKFDSRLIAIKRISDILARWKSSSDEVKNTSSTDDYCISEEDVDKLLNLCSRGLKTSSRPAV